MIWDMAGSHKPIAILFGAQIRSKHGEGKRQEKIIPSEISAVLAIAKL